MTSSLFHSFISFFDYFTLWKYVLALDESVVGMVCGTAAGEAETPEHHQKLFLPCLKGMNWALSVVVVVCVVDS